MHKFLWLALLGIGAACGKNKDSPSAAPASGEVEGAFFIPQYGYLTSYFSAFLLLKDGSIKKHLTPPPALLNDTASKQSDPDDWGTWKQAGDSILVNWHGGSHEAWDTWYFGVPAKKGETLSGHYISQFAVENKEYVGFTFTKDGRFSLNVQKAGSETRSGTYLLDSYGITLDFEDGHTEQWAFNFYCLGHHTRTPQKNSNAFILAQR